MSQNDWETDDELTKLEASLRQFQPRRPRPLPDMVSRRSAWPLLVSAAAALVIATAGVLFFAWKPSPHRLEIAEPSGLGAPRMDNAPVTVALGALTALALQNPDRLDETLTRISRTVLPDVGRPDGSLRQLAKD